MKSRFRIPFFSRNKAMKSGAVSFVTDWRVRLGAWAHNHGQVAIDSARRMGDSLLSSFMTWTVIGIAVALPAWLYLTLINLGDISGDWSNQSRISVYLEQNVAEAAAQELNQRISSIEGVRSTHYISAQQALVDFQQSSGLSEILRGLPGNPLPGTIVVYPGSDSVSDIRWLSLRLGELAGVDSVSIDLMWVERLHTILELGRRIVIALSVLLGAAVMLVVGNTIRLMIENRRAEIEVIKLVGGTDGFVRRPFLYTGLWYGLGGGLVSLLLIEISMIWVTGPFSALLGLYDSQHQFVRIGVVGTGVILLGSMAFGLTGAWLAVNRHLVEIEPD